jgi:hypothetical protein
MWPQSAKRSRPVTSRSRCAAARKGDDSRRTPAATPAAVAVVYVRGCVLLRSRARLRHYAPTRCYRWLRRYGARRNHRHVDMALIKVSVGLVTVGRHVDLPRIYGPTGRSTIAVASPLRGTAVSVPKLAATPTTGIGRQSPVFLCPRRRIRRGTWCAVT